MSIKLKYTPIVVIVLLLFNTSACTNKQKAGKTSGNITININTSKTYQQIDGFGASDAWSFKYVGKNWPLQKRQQIADLLFSRNTDENGNPKGIGLSIWRFNIGAGSAEQAENSNIENPWRREECFLNPDGSYNWQKQQGQQWFLRAAKERGVEKLVLFANSPPVYFTKNGKAYSSGGKNFNLKPGNYTHYANFLATVAKYFSTQGLNIDYISPENEPQWDWTTDKNNKASQEGTPALNSEIALIAKHLSKSIDDNNLNTKISITDAGKVTFLYDTTDIERGQQINDFFNPLSLNYVGNLKNMANHICSHSYWVVHPVKNLIASRQKIKQTIGQINPGLNYWESEYCILEEPNNDIAGGSKRDLSINLALYVARVIHYALVAGNASAWQWWTAISKYDYKDGLIHIDDGKSNGGWDPEYCMHDGFIRDSKTLWALGNYSLFVRPGMVRVECLSDQINQNQEYGVLPTAFIHPLTGKTVVVLVNYGIEQKNISLNFDGQKNTSFNTYVTSNSLNLAFTGKANVNNIILQPNSITTLVSNN